MLPTFVGILAGCAGPAPAPTPVVPPPFAGQVLGRDARFMIYDPGPDDTLASLAQRFLGDSQRNWVIADFNEIDHVAVGQPLAIPLAPINPVAVRATSYQVVPILCYHRFGPGKNRMIVSATQFAAQLDWLDHNGYRVIPLRQLIGFFAGRESIPQRAVVITIDDGHESTYDYAVPLLRKHGFPATLFLYSDYIGSSGALSWTQIRTLAASGEFEIGAHSKTHRNLSVRNADESDASYRRNLDVEMHNPIDLFGHRLDIPIRTYAYPYGDANALVLAALAKEKIDLAVTVTAGSNAFFAQPVLLRRTMIFGEYDLETFKSKLQVSRRLVE